MYNNELFSTTFKANLESQLALYRTWSSASVGYAEEVIALGVDTVKAGMAENAALGQKLLAARDPQECLSCASSRLQGNLENALALARQVTGLALKTQGRISSEMEAHVSDAQRKVSALVDNMASNAPAGSHGALALMKSALDSANNGYGQFSRAARQVADLVDGQLATAANHFPSSPEKSAARTAPK
jgi:phasin family protein